MPFVEGSKLKKRPFRYLNCMNSHKSSSEVKARNPTSKLSTLKGLTKSGIKLQKHGKVAKRLEIEVQPTPPDEKLLSKYQHGQLIDLSASQCINSETHSISIEPPGRVCSEVSPGTNAKGKARPVPAPRKFATLPRDTVDADEVSNEWDVTSMHSASVSLQLPKELSPTSVPKRSKSESAPCKAPLSPCPSRPPTQSIYKISTLPGTQTAQSNPENLGLSKQVRIRSQTLPRSFPKSLPPEHPPEKSHEKISNSITSSISAPVSPMADSLAVPQTVYCSSTLKPQLRPAVHTLTCRDLYSEPKRNECSVPNEYRFALLKPQNRSSCKLNEVKLLRSRHHQLFTLTYFKPSLNAILISDQVMI